MSLLCPTQAHLLLCELLRCKAALSIQYELESLCALHLPAAVADAKGLFPAAVFEGHQHTAARVSTASASPSPPPLPSDGGASPLCDAAHARTWVHPILDVRRRAEVCRVDHTGDAAPRYSLTGVQYVKGAILGVVDPLPDFPHAAAETPHARGEPLTAALSELRLATPEPFYHDPLLPSLESIEPHHASKNLLDLWLSKLCGSADKLDSSFNQKRKRAWHLTDEATYVFYVTRKRLAEQLAALSELWSNTAEHPPPCTVRVTVETDSAALREELHLPTAPSPPHSPGHSSTTVVVVVDVLWDTSERAAELCRGLMADVAGSHAHGGGGVHWCSPDARTTRVTLPISADALRRLHRRYTLRRAPSSADPAATTAAFCYAVARLLLRYHALSGGDMEKESGWQAAVPSCVMDVFEHFPVGASPHQRSSTAPEVVTVECFASPFNATRPFFFSVFVDTDAPFGSLGNFFACRSAQECAEAVGAGAAAPAITLLRLECNPPFDHEVIAAAFRQLLRWLETPSESVCTSVLIIIPDSSQAHAAEVRGGVERSPLRRWMASIAATQCLYVHGAQQQQQQEEREEEEEAVAPQTNAPSRKRRRNGESSRLVKLSCPTRVFVVQDEAAERLCSGVQVGEEVARAWRSLSLSGAL